MTQLLSTCVGSGCSLMSQIIRFSVDSELHDCRIHGRSLNVRNGWRAHHLDDKLQVDLGDVRFAALPASKCAAEVEKTTLRICGFWPRFSPFLSNQEVQRWPPPDVFALEQEGLRF